MSEDILSAAEMHQAARRQFVGGEGDQAALQLNNIVRTFRQGRESLEVLRGVNLRVHAGEIVGLVGPSGSGKSTLLHVAGLLERPDAGEVAIAGTPCGRLGDRAQDRHRRYGYYCCAARTLDRGGRDTECPSLPGARHVQSRYVAI